MTAPETIFVTADVDELADTIDLYAQTTPEGMTGEPERYTRTKLVHETHIRRDDPALRQVMGSLTFLEKQLDSHGFREDGPMLSAVSGALAAMQELIGGKDG